MGCSISYDWIPAITRHAKRFSHSLVVVLRPGGSFSVTLIAKKS
jgi:hypothetical protein